MVLSAVEASSAGTPVIAYKAGGALDYVKEGITGSFFAEQTVDSLMATLQAFEPEKYDRQAIMTEAEQYSTARFTARMTETLQEILKTRFTKD